jgi:ribonuclease Z
MSNPVRARFRATSATGHASQSLRNADLLFIEAVFLEADRASAERKAHLTIAQAGEIARTAAVKRAGPFHFSSRYRDREVNLAEEFVRAWHGN